MNVAVDLDGVVYQWSPTARYLLNTHRGGSFHYEPRAWNWIPNPADDEWLFSEGVTEYGLFRYGAVYRGAIDGIDALFGMVNEICFITHRPKVAVADTEEWVEFFFPNIPLHLATDGEPKSTMCASADVLIDDKPENCIEWIEAGRHGAILVDQPWNQDHPIFEYEPKILRAQGGWNIKTLHNTHVGILWAVDEHQRRFDA